MYIHNINPVLLHIGPLEIRYYGLAYVIGFLLLYWTLIKARQKGTLRLSRNDVDNFMLFGMIWLIVGARLVHVLFVDPLFYISHPIEILMIWHGGLAFHGGLIGILLYALWFSKTRKISFYKLADLGVIPAAFALAIGRIANFINGELWGTLSNKSWCVQFPDIFGCRHPSQLYSALGRFAVFGMLLGFRAKKVKDGFVFWSFIGLMSIERFVVDFWREDIKYFSLSFAQWTSIILVIITAYILIRYYREDISIKRNAL